MEPLNNKKEQLIDDGNAQLDIAPMELKKLVLKKPKNNAVALSEINIALDISEIKPAIKKSNSNSIHVISNNSQPEEEFDQSLDATVMFFPRKGGPNALANNRNSIN